MEVVDAETGEKITIKSAPKVVNAATQSQRDLGDQIGWKTTQIAKEERRERRFRASMEGVRLELHRQKHDATAVQKLRIELLEKMKAQYNRQITRLVQEEMTREKERQVALRLEQSTIGKERLRKKQEQERAFYDLQIRRIREECEQSLAATMVQYNLLR